MRNQPAVTVAVPTRARPDALGRCLRALAGQTIADELEVLVVCDGDDYESAVARVVAGVPQARLLRQAQAGPGATRNRAAAAAAAPVLCCTDDDCEPRPDWAERLVHAIDRGADVAVGRTVNAEPKNALATASQLVVTHLEERSARAGQVYGAASNFGARTEVLRKVPFDTRYTFAGGDRDWCARVAEAGFRLVREPDAVVLHRQRLSVGSFSRQHVAYGRGAYRFRSASRPLRLERPGFYGSLVLRAAAAGPRVTLLVLLAQAATAVGFAREARRLSALRSRRARGIRRRGPDAPRSRT
ncbi:MAG TPA: glycosyltransferase [Gaiellaceae bacterium]